MSLQVGQDLPDRPHVSVMKAYGHEMVIDPERLLFFCWPGRV